MLAAYRRGGVDDLALGPLTDLARQRRAATLRTTAAAAPLSARLRQAGVVHAVVKGPALALAWPGGDREFTDLDLLVAPADVPFVAALLSAGGATAPEGTAWPRSDGVGELPLLLPDGTAVDLHGELVHRAGVRRVLDLASGPLLTRVRTVDLPGGPVPTLDPADSLVHVAVHAAISGGDRLVWLGDLDALARRATPPWPTLLERAHRARAALVVGVMLARAAAVLATPVPAGVLASLIRGGRVWAGGVAAFDRARPTAASWGRPVRGQVLVRATRDGTGTSLRALAGLAWTDVIRYVATDPDHPWRARRRRA